MPRPARRSETPYPTGCSPAGGFRRLGPGRTRQMNALIQVSDVSKRYDNDGAYAVENVSLGVAAGDAVAIMGPSGSGKSTLLNLIGGLDRPSSGTVTVAGQRIDSLSETSLARYRRQRVGMIFQFFNLLDDLTVADNVLLPAQLAGMPRPGPAVRSVSSLTACTSASTRRLTRRGCRAESGSGLRSREHS